MNLSRFFVLSLYMRLLVWSVLQNEGQCDSFVPLASQVDAEEERAGQTLLRYKTTVSQNWPES